FPGFKVCYAESQIGWIPYVIERADDLFLQQPATFESLLKDKPSTYYHDHVYSCFFRDPIGVRTLDVVGPSQVLFEVDFPHGDTTFPNSEKAADEQFGHLDQETVNKIARNNMIDLLGLTSFEKA